MAALAKVLARPPCLQAGLTLGVPLLAAALGAAPPVWVDVRYSIKPVKWDVPAASQAQKDDCLTHLAGAVGLQTMPYSWHKATRASEYVFW